MKCVVEALFYLAAMEKTSLHGCETKAGVGRTRNQARKRQPQDKRMCLGIQLMETPIHIPPSLPPLLPPSLPPSLLQTDVCVRGRPLGLLHAGRDPGQLRQPELRLSDGAGAQHDPLHGYGALRTARAAQGPQDTGGATSTLFELRT